MPVKKKSDTILLVTIALAFFINIKGVNIILGAMLGLNEESGFMSILYSSNIIFMYAFSLYIYGIRNLNKKVIIYISVFLAWYFYTKSFIQEPRISITFFMVFTISAFLIPSIAKVDVKLLLLAIMIIPSIGVFYTSKVFSTEGSFNETISMTASYAFMVPVVATILYWWFYYKYDGVYMKTIVILFSMINMVFLYKILSFGSRGPFVCILMVFFVLFLFNKKEETGINVNKIRLSIMTLVVALFSVSFMWIIAYTNDLLKGMGLSFNVVDKFIRMDQGGDWTNGREYISEIAMAGIADSPIFGHGVDQFENNTGISYPHNFILQILYDGGIFFFMIFLIPLAMMLVNKLKKCNIDEFVLTVFLLTISVPGALASADLWNNERLWIFFGYLFSTSFVLKKR